MYNTQTELMQANSGTEILTCVHIRIRYNNVIVMHVFCSSRAPDPCHVVWIWNKTSNL